MRNLIFTEQELASEMTVVRNEMERGQNDPSSVLMEELFAVAFREHPYHHPTIGWKSDVENITVERLKWFNDTFYWPDNTTLFLMGDLDTADALALVAKYYGAHTRSPHAIPRVHTTEPRQEGERRFTINRPGDAAHVGIAFHVPEAAHADTYALSAMTDVLGGSRKTTRLYKALIETGLAAGVSVISFQLRDPGMFLVLATVAPGSTPEAVEAAIYAEIDKLAKEPVAAEELRRAQAANTKATILASADPMAMANQLAEAEAGADWSFYTEYADKFNAVTVADVQRVAATYFASDNRTVGHFIPKADESNGAQVETDQESDAAAEAPEVVVAKTSQFAEKSSKIVLDNGMTLVLMPATGNGIVGISGKLRAGAAHAAQDKVLVPSLAAAQMLSGTTTRSAEQISSTLEEMGAGLGFNSGMFGTSFRTQIVSSDLPAMISLIADTLRNPSFPQSEFDTARMQYRSYFEQRLSDTESAASEALSHALYAAESIYYQNSPQDLIKELETLNASDLKSYHEAFASPKGMVMTLAGDFDLAATEALVRSAFADWTGPEVKAVEVPQVALPTERKRVNVIIPGKSNASIVIGHPSTLLRTADDFFASRLVNGILGGDTISGRLGVAVRRDAGLTYGIYSSFGDTTKGGAAWTIELSVNPQNVDKALSIIDKVMDDFVKNGVTAEELSLEAKSTAGTFIVQLRRFDAIASTINEYEFLGLGIEALDEYATRIQSVTLEEANAAIRKYIRPELFVTAVAGSLK